MLTVEEKLRLLRINSFLGNAPLALLREAAAAAAERYFDRGQFVYAKCDPAQDLYLLVEGRITHPEVHTEEQHPAHRIATSGQGFGFAAAVQGQPPRVVSAQCELATTVLAINGEWLRLLCTRYGSDGQELLRLLEQAHASYERNVLALSGWVSVRNVSKSFRPAGRVLFDCSFEVRSGELCAIVGPQRSGKSTLAKLIAGFDAVDDGIIYFDGKVINRPGMKRTPGRDRQIVPGPLPTRATVKEILLESADKAMPRDRTLANVTQWIERLQLSRVENVRVRNVAIAERRLVELIAAFTGHGDAVILDEPFRGLDNIGAERARDCLAQLYDAFRKTVILLTEKIDDAMLFADRILFLDRRITRTVPIDLPRPRANARLNDPQFALLSRIAAQAAHESLDEANQTEMLDADVTVEVPTGWRDVEVVPAKPVSHEPLPTAANAIREALHNGRFFWTIEFIPSRDKVLRDELHKLGGIAGVLADDRLLAGFSVTDRVVSERDPDPVAAASHLCAVTRKQPLVHFSGKGRELPHLHDFISRLHENGLKNALILTGDRLKQEPNDQRARYLESVPAIHAAKHAYPDLFVAAALNPFKYREEDAMAQYLKLGKKVGAGADFIITQIGFDMHKYEEALLWVDTRDYRLPLVANVMPLSAQRARYIRLHQLAGVTVTDSFLALLEEEERGLADKGASRVLRRLALQILGMRYYGYAGVQLTGLHSVEKVLALQAMVRDLSELCSDRLTWNKAWEESLTFAEGGRANPAPAHNPWYFMSPRPRHTSARERFKYKVMDRVHSFLFDRGLGARVLGPPLRPVKRHSAIDRVLERIERGIKAPIFGCETCGMCRLAATQYVCPETCPKGLANGACGGTTENLCEFRDRECVHSVKYRIAKDAGVLHELETWLIPAVPADFRYSCSWPPHFRNEGPKLKVIDFLHPEKKQFRNW